MAQEKYDVVIVGGGPGGYTAAIRAGHLGLRTAVVERDRIGGVCLNRGCIPTKAILASAAHYDKIMKGEMGLDVPELPIFNDAAVMERSRKVVGNLVKGVGLLLRKRGVDLYHGEGEVSRKGFVAVHAGEGREELPCDNIVLATGSTPFVPPGMEPDGERVLTTDDILEDGVLPSGHVAVIGGGVIGMEFASFFSMAGRQVTVVELLPDILSMVEPDLRKELVRRCRKRKVKIRTGTKVEDLERREDGVTIRLSGDESLDVDFVMVAVGRKPHFPGVDLNALGIELNEAGRIAVDGVCRVSEGLYAIGDAAGEAPMLAHSASHQGIIAVEHISSGRELALPPVAWVVYSKPELATVGMTEEQARDKFGGDFQVGRFPMRALGRAQTVSELDGFAKVVAGPDGTIVGFHFAADEASDLVALGLLAVKEKLKLSELAEAPMPHPSFSECVMEASWVALGAPISIP